MRKWTLRSWKKATDLKKFSLRGGMPRSELRNVHFEGIIKQLLNSPFIGC